MTIMYTPVPIRLTPFLLSLALAGCGGSSGSGDDPNDSAAVPGNGIEIGSSTSAELPGIGGTSELVDTVPGTITAEPNGVTEVTGIADDDPLEGDDASLPGSLAPELPDTDAEDCSVSAQNRWVDDAMRDYYLYYDQVPVVDLEAYASPEDLLEDLTVNPPDRFSFITDSQQFTNLFQEEGTRFGLGFRLVRNAADNVRVAQVDAASPADLAGIRRGDRVLEANGEPISAIDSNAAYVEVFGTDTLGEEVTVTLTLENADGELTTATASTDEYPAFSAPSSSVLRSETNPTVGYIVFDEFLEGAAREVAEYLSAFNEEGVQEVIIDLRYNTGGLVDEALITGSQLGGKAVAGQVAERILFNDKYAAQYDQDLLFPPVDTTIELPRVIFLTTERSASSAESLINTLKPYKEVVVIGTDKTLGKATAFRANPRCDKLLFAVDSTAVNSVGESVEFGIPPDCLVRDTAEHELGDPRESMLDAALRYVVEGSCATPAAAAASSGTRRAGEPAGEMIGPKPVPMAIRE